jgi:hypothetical protein
MGLVLTEAGQLLCPHGAPVIVTVERPDLLIEGLPVLRMADPALVPGCPYTSEDGSSQPCMYVQWTGAIGTFEGEAVLTTDSVGMCMSAGGDVNGLVQIIIPGQTSVWA